MPVVDRVGWSVVPVGWSMVGAAWPLVRVGWSVTVPEWTGDVTGDRVGMDRWPESTVTAVRPDRIVLVCGTGTEVGKTWVGAALLRSLRGRGMEVAARKVAQSFDLDEAGRPLDGPTDAEVLAAASGEDPRTVCRIERTYHRAMAPPMAAEALGLPPFTVADLVDELAWPDRHVDVGLVETAGGVRSPQAIDGDVPELVNALRPDAVVMVADAGLGTINAVRLSMAALVPGGSVPASTSSVGDRPSLMATASGAGQLSDASPREGRQPASLAETIGSGAPAGSRVADAGPPCIVVLNRFDCYHELHLRNRQWLVERDGIPLVVLPGDGGPLADFVVGRE